MIYRESQQLERWQTRFASFSNDVARLEAGNPEQQALVRNIQANTQRLRDVFDSVVAAVGSPSTGQSRAIDPAVLRVSWSRMAVQSQALVSDASRLSQLLDNEASQSQRMNTIVVIALIVIFIAYFLVNYLLMQRRALKGLAKLQAGTAVIGAGNLDFRIEERRNDEIGDLSHAFNRMAANLKTVTASKTDLEREIDERKKAEEALKRSEVQLRAIFENVDEGLVVSDLNGQFLYWNRTAMEMHGFTSPEEANRKLPEFQDTFVLADKEGNVLPITEWPLARILRGDNLDDWEIHIRRVNSDWNRIWEYNGALIRTEEGTPFLALVTVKDITEHKKAESGRTADRPAFREMIALARMKHPPFGAVLVWKLNRFARNREDSIIFKSLLRKQDIQVISINEPLEDTPAGRLLEGIIEVIDEFYSSNMAQDVTRGMRENAMRGYFSGGSPPSGYAVTKVKDGIKMRSTLVPEPSLSLVVKRIFDEYSSGKGLKEIAKSLNRDGIPTRCGKRWGSTVVHQVLTNEAYKGTLVWGKRRRRNMEPVRVEKAWPAIVGDSVFDSVQAQLKARGPKLTHPRRIASEYLLSGLLKCGVCGNAMSGHSTKSGKFFYYRCGNASKRGPEECPGHWLPKEKLEHFVVDKIRNHILDDGNLTELANITKEEVDSKIRSQREQLEVLDSQIKDVELRLEHLYDALEKGSFSQEELAPRIRKLQARKEELELARHQMDYSIQSKLIEAPDMQKVQAYVADLRSLLVSSPIVEQKAFLKGFNKDVVVGSKELTINYTMPLDTGTQLGTLRKFYLLSLMVSCVGLEPKTLFRLPPPSPPPPPPFPHQNLLPQAAP